MLTQTGTPTMSLVHLRDEAHFSSTWSVFAYTPSPSRVHPLVMTQAPLFSTSLAGCAGEGPSMSSYEGVASEMKVGGWGGTEAVGQANPSLISTMHQRPHIA